MISFLEFTLHRILYIIIIIIIKYIMREGGLNNKGKMRDAWFLKIVVRKS